MILTIFYPYKSEIAMFQNKRTTISTVHDRASKVGGHVARSGGHLPPPPGAALRLLRPRAQVLALHHHQQDPGVNQLRGRLQSILPSARSEVGVQLYLNIL